MKKVFTLSLLSFYLLLSAFTLLRPEDIYTTSSGVVRFATKGPLGNIIAQSAKLTGTFDVSKKTFSLTIPVTSFEGFQNSLQKKHFNEKYMESDKIPMASFKGKIIEDIDFTVAGVYPIRAKGTMKIHDTEKELIIKSKVTVKPGQITVESAFNILLEDFSIKIPTIASKKVDEDIAVAVKVDMTPKK